MSKHTIVAVDADSSTHNRLVQVVPDQQQQCIHVIVSKSYSAPDEISTEIKILKPASLSIIIGYENGAKIFDTDRFQVSQFEGVKQNFLITDEQNSDYFLVGSKAVLSTTSRESIKSLAYLFTDLGAKTAFNINHVSVVLIYGFNRNYPDYFDDKTVGLLHISGETATFIVIDHGRLLWHGRKKEVQLNNTKNLRKLVDGVEQELIAKDETFSFDYILLSGEISTSNLDLLANFKGEDVSATVENWDLRRSGLFKFEECQISTTHEWVIALCGALMACENLGIDLSLTNPSLIRELKQEMEFNINESISEKLLETGRIIGRAVWPAIVAQRYLIGACLVMGLVLFGYRYYAIATEDSNLQTKLSNETQRSTALANVKTEYGEYKNYVRIINERITQIYSIRESQLAVPTTLKSLLDGTPQLVNYGHIDVVGTNIKADGESYDKATAVNFISKIGSSGEFEDINPVYDSQSAKCQFNFSTHYRGLVLSLNPRNPVPQQIVKVQ